MTSPDYPFPELLPQLQILCSPDQYRRIIGQRIRERGFIPYQSQEYWQVVPKYLFARCPICGYAYRQAADTYSLRAWGGFNRLWEALYGTFEQVPDKIGCPHFQGIAKFTNLHGQIPDELDWFQQETGEVPFITPGLLPEAIPSYAVLHALPICRIGKDEEAGQERFLPRYTVFLLTYFAQDPKAVLQLHWKKQIAWAADDDEFMPETLKPAGTQPNLDEWVEKGQLGWLDYSEPALPLRIGNGLRLPSPYHRIPGNTRRYSYVASRSEGERGRGETR